MLSLGATRVSLRETQAFPEPETSNNLTTPALRRPNSLLRCKPFKPVSTLSHQKPLSPSSPVLPKERSENSDPKP